MTPHKNTEKERLAFVVASGGNSLIYLYIHPSIFLSSSFPLSLSPSLNQSTNKKTHAKSQ